MYTQPCYDGCSVLRKRPVEGSIGEGMIRMNPAEKTKFLQVRMSEEERETVDALAKEYGMDASNFIRAMISFVDQQRPVLRIVTLKKEPALA